MDYADTFELPVIIKIDGEEKAIPLLSQRDYQPWLSQLTTDRKTADLKLIPPTMKGTELFNLKRQIEFNSVLPADIEPIIYTADGTVKVLVIALGKIGMKEDKANAFIDAQPAGANTNLALRVSGLVPRRRLEAMGVIEKPADPRPSKTDEPSTNP